MLAIRRQSQTVHNPIVIVTITSTIFIIF